MKEFNSKEYWEKRYKKSGNSGLGSYGDECKWKSTYVNNVINQYNIRTINDYGHGDCNQIQYIKGFVKYYGYDVSETIRKKCKEKFDDSKYNFIDNVNDFPFSDLSMSLDVIYHLIEYSIYEKYLKDLFSKSTYVVIYSTDRDEKKSNHVTHRTFSDYIRENFKDYKLINTDFSFRDDCGMYLYKKI